MMVGVVNDPGAEGKRAKIPGYSMEIAGKTGTAQVALPNGGGYGPNVVASFVGFMPAATAQFTMMVILNNPQVNAGNRFGSILAAPIWKQDGRDDDRRLADRAMKETILIGVLAFIAGVVLYPVFISLLVRFGARQHVASYSPASHRAKEGTPDARGPAVLPGGDRRVARGRSLPPGVHPDLRLARRGDRRARWPRRRRQHQRRLEGSASPCTEARAPCGEVAGVLVGVGLTIAGFWNCQFFPELGAPTSGGVSRSWRLHSRSRRHQQRGQPDRRRRRARRVVHGNARAHRPRHHRGDPRRPVGRGCHRRSSSRVRSRRSCSSTGFQRARLHGRRQGPAGARLRRRSRLTAELAPHLAAAGPRHRVCRRRGGQRGGQRHRDPQGSCHPRSCARARSHRIASEGSGSASAGLVAAFAAANAAAQVPPSPCSSPTSPVRSRERETGGGDRRPGAAASPVPGRWPARVIESSSSIGSDTLVIRERTALLPASVEVRLGGRIPRTSPRRRFMVLPEPGSALERARAADRS